VVVYADLHSIDSPAELRTLRRITLQCIILGEDAKGQAFSRHAIDLSVLLL